MSCERCPEKRASLRWAVVMLCDGCFRYAKDPIGWPDPLKEPHV